MYFILFAFIINVAPIYSQNLLVEYTGSASATNISGSETYSIVKNYGGTIINMCLEMPIPYTESVQNNSQNISNVYVYSMPVSSSYEVIYFEGVSFS